MQFGKRIENILNENKNTVAQEVPETKEEFLKRIKSVEVSTNGVNGRNKGDAINFEIGK